MIALEQRKYLGNVRFPFRVLCNLVDILDLTSIVSFHELNYTILEMFSCFVSNFLIQTHPSIRLLVHLFYLLLQMTYLSFIIANWKF